MSVEEEARRLAALPADERKQILALLSALAPEQETSSSYESEVWQAITKQVEGLPPFGVFRKQRYYKSFREGCEVLGKFVTSFAKTRVERHKATALLCGMLLRRLRVDKIPRTPQVIAQQLRRIPDICEDSFPGYGSSGLLATLVTTKAIPDDEPE